MVCMSKAIQYTHKTKGGLYEIVINGPEHGSIITAGTMKGDGIVLYRAVDTGQVYARFHKDFYSSMKTVSK